MRHLRWCHTLFHRSNPLAGRERWNAPPGFLFRIDETRTLMRKKMSDLQVLTPMILTVPVATPVLIVAWIFMQMTANMDEGRIAPIVLAWLPAAPMVTWLLNGGSVSLAEFFIASALSGITVLLLALRVQPATRTHNWVSSTLTSAAWGICANVGFTLALAPLIWPLEA